MRRKEERSKQGQTNNKAKQHSIPICKKYLPVLQNTLTTNLAVAFIPVYNFNRQLIPVGKTCLFAGEGVGWDGRGLGGPVIAPPALICCKLQKQRERRTS